MKDSLQSYGTSKFQQFNLLELYRFHRSVERITQNREMIIENSTQYISSIKTYIVVFEQLNLKREIVYILN